MKISYITLISAIFGLCRTMKKKMKIGGIFFFCTIFFYFKKLIFLSKFLNQNNFNSLKSSTAGNMSFSGNESFILCTHPLPTPAQSTSALPPIVSTINYNGSSSKQDTRLCVVASGIGLGVYNVSEYFKLYGSSEKS